MRVKMYSCQLCLHQPCAYPVCINKVPSAGDIDSGEKLANCDHSCGGRCRVLGHDIKDGYAAESHCGPCKWDQVAWEGIEPERGRLRASKILHLVPRGGLHLDVGVGRGDGMSLISERTRCVGFDYGIRSTRIAKEKGLEVYQADGRKMPFKSGSFDSVTCLDVLEHVPGPDELVREVSRVLKRGGVFILQTPTSDMLKERLLRFLRERRMREQKQPYDSPLRLGDIRRLLRMNHCWIISERKIRIWASNPLVRAISFSRVFYCVCKDEAVLIAERGKSDIYLSLLL